jgi:hypothetical protein
VPILPLFETAKNHYETFKKLLAQRENVTPPNDVQLAAKWGVERLLRLGGLFDQKGTLNMQRTEGAAKRVVKHQVTRREVVDWADKPNLDAQIEGLSGALKVAMMDAMKQFLPAALKVPAVRTNTRGLTDKVKEAFAKVKELEIPPFSAADGADFDLKNDMYEGNILADPELA